MLVLNLFKRIIFYGFLMFFVTGCISKPNDSELLNADYGKPINQHEAEGLARTWFNSTLKDPFSAQYNFSQASQGYYVTPVIEGAKRYFGYQMKVNVNAKNSFGAYGGFKEYIFMFKNGKTQLVVGPPEGEYKLRRYFYN